MTGTLEIRASVPADLDALESLYPAAFPDEDLLPLVRELLQDETVVTSLVAEIDSELVGHIVFTDCGVSGQAVKVALLGPLGVTPARHGQGIGSELVLTGLRHMKARGADVVCVLGDPAYYSRFGFRTESAIDPPYALPAEWDGAWQSQTLGDPVSCPGQLTVPQYWNQRSLWTT